MGFDLVSIPLLLGSSWLCLGDVDRLGQAKLKPDADMLSSWGRKFPFLPLVTQVC